MTVALFRSPLPWCGGRPVPVASPRVQSAVKVLRIIVLPITDFLAVTLRSVVMGRRPFPRKGQLFLMFLRTSRTVVRLLLPLVSRHIRVRPRASIIVIRTPNPTLVKLNSLLITELSVVMNRRSLKVLQIRVQSGCRNILVLTNRRKPFLNLLGRGRH